MATFNEKEEMAIVSALFHLAQIDRNYNYQERKFIDSLRRDFSLTTTKMEIAKKLSFDDSLSILKKMSSSDKSKLQELISKMILADNRTHFKEESLYKTLLRKL